MKKYIATILTLILISAYPINLLASTDFNIESLGTDTSPVVFKVFKSGSGWKSVFSIAPTGELTILQPLTMSSGGLGLDYLDIDTTAAPADAVGRIKWNNTDGTIEVGLKGGNSTLQVGQETVLRVYNSTGSPMVDGQVVRIIGTQGSSRVSVALAQADTQANATRLAGIVTETIPSHSEGFVTRFGLVRNFDTFAFTEGAPVYLSPTVPGGLTSIQPTTPYVEVSIGECIRKNNNNGILLVNTPAHPAFHSLTAYRVPFAGGPTTLIDDAGMYYTSGTDTLTAGTFEGPVTALKSATTSVDVSASPAPSAGKALVATDSTHATWQTVSATDATKMPLAGGTFTGNVLFTDNLYDIGANAATRPRTGYFGTSVVSPLFSGPATALKTASASVSVSAATAPTLGQVLTATSGTTATWQTVSTASDTTKMPLAGGIFTGSIYFETDNTHDIGDGGGASPRTGYFATSVDAPLFTGAVTALKSATTSVGVSAAAAPTAGQVLMATSGTAATWQTPVSQSPWTGGINAAGYTLSGNSTASGNLTLDSTSDSTKGFVNINPSGGNVGVGTASPSGTLSIAQTAAATGAKKGIVYTGAVNTNQTLSTEIPSVTFTTAGRQWATGALTSQREILITQPTYSFVGASTITNAATVAITGAPVQSTNATITNAHGLLIEAGATGTATQSYGLTVNAQTGSSLSYAAQFMGGNVGIGTSQPAELLSLGLAGTTKGVLSLSGNTSGKIIIQPAAAAGTYTLTLPVDDGTPSQYLQSNGSGVLTWANASDATKLPLTGGTLTGNLIFTDNTYDIGASGATRPRTGYFGTSVVSPLFTGPATALKSATTSVDVSSATAPSSGQALVATASTTATWQTIPLLASNQTFSGVVQHSKQYAAQAYTQSYAAAQTIDWNNGNVQIITLTGNITSFTMSNPITGGRYVMIMKQDGTGSRSIVWPTAVKWPGSTTPTSSGASKVDVYSCVYDGTNYYCGANSNYL